MANLELNQPKWVDNLVKIAMDEANKNNNGNLDLTSEGLCLNAVENTLEKALKIKAKRPVSAYMFPNFYNTYPEFRQFYGIVDKTNPLKFLPLGAIVVWGKTEKHKHGHIEIKTKQPLQFTSDYTQLERSTYSGNKTPIAIYIPK